MRVRRVCQPTSARGALPCWDEPALKATFAVTLVSRAGTVSLSNMPVLPDSPATDTKALADDEKALYAGVAEGDWVVSKYATTPPVRRPVRAARTGACLLIEALRLQMSTYLLAYANGPFEYLESSYKSPLSGAVRPLRIYGARPSLRARPRRRVHAPFPDFASLSCSFSARVQRPRTASTRRSSRSTSRRRCSRCTSRCSTSSTRSRSSTRSSRATLTPARWRTGCAASRFSLPSALAGGAN